MRVYKSIQQRGRAEGSQIFTSREEPKATHLPIPWHPQSPGFGLLFGSCSLNDSWSQTKQHLEKTSCTSVCVCELCCFL